MRSKKEINKYLGYKFFKELEDGSFEIIRLTHIYEFNNKVTVVNEETKLKKQIVFEALKDYTPLEPFGFVSFSDVSVEDRNGDKQKDVIVTLYRLLDVRIGLNEPFAICRQSVTDFFYSTFAQKYDHEMVGISVTRDNCPANIPYHMVAACDEVNKFEIVNFYLEDTVEDILNCIFVKYYDDILTDLFNDHIKATGKFMMSEKSSVDGWCKKLSTLLKDNNFITDMDTIRDIAAVDFNLSDYFEEFKTIKNEKGYKLNNEVLEFFCNTFKVNAVETSVLKYGHDIDLSEFNNTNYTLIRDNTNTLYIVAYLVDGEYLEKDLQDNSEKKDVTTKLRLAFYDKYCAK